MLPKGANSMAMSGLRGRKVMAGTGRAISMYKQLGMGLVSMLY